MSDPFDTIRETLEHLNGSGHPNMVDVALAALDELRKQLRQAERDLYAARVNEPAAEIAAANIRADRAEQENRQMTKALEIALRRAPDEPIGVDISDYNDDFCRGFLAGQESVLEEILRDPAALAAAEDAE